MAYYLCIDVPEAKKPKSNNSIIDVKLTEPEQDKYEVESEELEPCLLTEYLKKRGMPNFSQQLMKLTFSKTPTDKCKQALEEGVFCQNAPYFFLGHTDDQLKKKSCYFMRATHKEIHEHLAKFGDFLEEENLGKRARKIGMLFSPLNITVPLAREEYRVVPDIKRGVFRSYTFTDGCGFMSPEFSSRVQESLKLDDQPSAIQVRYRGIEGMLVLKEDLTGVQVQFHNSMQKFVTPAENMPEDFDFADVVDYSRPYVNGYLDNRKVMLLAELGVPGEHLKKLQSAYYSLLEDICKSEAAAENFLRLKGMASYTKTTLKSSRKEEVDEMQKAAYTRLLVPKSRVVFAVCDPYNKLKGGECYFNPTVPEDEARNFLTGQQFVIMRESCYHPGDVRVLKLTSEKQGYENLRDCLVLPVKGPRPHALECSGGYLGGDKFFVSWDDNIIPKKMTSPCAYPSKDSAGTRKAMAAFVPSCISPRSQLRPDRLNERGREEMREYFSNFTDDLTDKIEKTYISFATATAFGPSSRECRKLSKMLYQAANLTEDKMALEKKWLKMKNKEPCKDNEVLSRDKATLSETSPLLPNSGQGKQSAKKAIRQPRFTFMGRFRRPRRPGYGVHEEIDKRAEEFVKLKQREYNRIIV